MAVEQEGLGTYSLAARYGPVSVRTATGTVPQAVMTAIRATDARRLERLRAMNRRLGIGRPPRRLVGNQSPMPCGELFVQVESVRRTRREAQPDRTFSPWMKTVSA